MIYALKHFRLLLFVLFVSSIGYSNGFLNNLFKGNTQATTVEEKIVVDPSTRGIPDNNLANYQQEVFFCDNKSRKLPKEFVNDNYCDCNDGSDEPGTNACNSGVFVCKNKNYKMVRIPSSRVDDGICDCCDGSDEGIVAKCEDTCVQMNEREQGKLNQVRENYRIGKQRRQQLIENATKDRQEKVSRIPSLKEEIEKLRTLQQQLRNEKESAEDNVRSQVQVDSKSHKQELLSLLGLSAESMNSNEYFIKLFQIITELVNYDIDKIKNVLIDLDLKKRYPPGSEEDLVEDESHLSLEEVSDRCELVRVTQDLRFQPLCRDISGASLLTTIREVVFAIVKEQEETLVNEIALVIGHEKVHRNHFEGALNFVTDFIAEHGVESCPQEFQEIAHHDYNCDTFKGNLRTVMNRFQNIDSHIADHPRVKEIQQRLNEVVGKTSQVEQQLRESEQAEKDLNNLKDYPELLALKDTCIEVDDGNYRYKHCLLKNVEQKEINGFHSVTLGSFDFIEDQLDEKEGIYLFKIHYTNGQHCHAFGARKADVLVRCGQETVLKSAAEPSTCFYQLEMESPAACTPEFAAVNGISE